MVGINITNILEVIALMFLVLAPVTVHGSEETVLVKRMVTEKFGVGHIMVEVARCESGWRQFDKNGLPLKNPGSSATGVFQIMKSYHEENALRLGMDVNTTEGNIEFAEHLYKESGLVPWKESAHCWGK